MAKVFVVVRDVIERTLIVDVPEADPPLNQDATFARAEEAVRVELAERMPDDWYRLRSDMSEVFEYVDGRWVPGWQVSELGFTPSELAIEAYDYADDDADRVFVTAAEVVRT